MYSVEYKCTNPETPQTMINITVDNESKQNPQFTTSSSEKNQLARKISQFEFKKAVS
jgi:hypothetical protein